MKKEEKTKLTRKRILTAALKEFGENGYFGATLNHICAYGIPKGLLYHNFENKDAIYLACLEQCYANLTSCLEKQVDSSSLNHYMDVRLRYFQEHPYEARLFFESILQPPSHLKDAILIIKEDFDKLTIRLCRELLSSLSLRPGITQTQALEYFSLLQTMFNGYFSCPAISSMNFSQLVAEHETKLAKFLDYMLYGIAERRDEE